MRKMMRMAAITLLYTVVVCGMANGETMVFQDSFTGALTTNWTPGTNTAVHAGGHQLAVADGSLVWSQSYDHIESKRTFSGDFRVEVDLERTQGSTRCWDFAIELTSASENTCVLRLQYGSQAVDSINVGAAPSTNTGGSTGTGVCVGDGGQWSAEAPTASPHDGTATLTYQNGNLTFSFMNTNGETITTGPVAVGDIGETTLRIWAMTNFRYVDEVRVYDLADGCPSSTPSLQVGASGYDLTIPSLCYDGQTYELNLKIRLKPDGTYEFF